MKNKIGTLVKLIKISDNDPTGMIPEKFPVGHTVEGILITKLDEGHSIKIVHLKNELNRIYGIFTSTNLINIEPKIDGPWTLTTRNSIYTVEEINNPNDDFILQNEK